MKGVGIGAVSGLDGLRVAVDPPGPGRGDGSLDGIWNQKIKCHVKNFILTQIGHPEPRRSVRRALRLTEAQGD